MGSSSFLIALKFKLNERLKYRRVVLMIIHLKEFELWNETWSKSISYIQWMQKDSRKISVKIWEIRWHSQELWTFKVLIHYLCGDPQLATSSFCKSSYRGHWWIGVIEVIGGQLSIGFVYRFSHIRFLEDWLTLWRWLSGRREEPFWP